MRGFIRWGVALVAAAAFLGACSPVPAPRPPAPAPGAGQPPASAESSLVVIPDATALLEKNASNWEYDGSDINAIGAEVRAYLAGYFDAIGLVADIEWQSIALPDSQEPSAGARVPAGTHVLIKIGIGD
jgi:hypothetical protein